MITPRDVLRLEVEQEPSGLQNLVQNPNGDLGGWGWLTTISGSAMRGVTDVNGPALEYQVNGTVIDFFNTEGLPVTAGQYVAASWAMVTSGTPAYVRGRFRFLDADKLLLGGTGQPTAQGAYVRDPGTYALPGVLIPAGAFYAELRFDVYGTTGGAVAGAGKFVRMRQVTVATAATSTALGSTFTNLIKNPVAGTNATGYVGGTGVNATSVARVLESSVPAAYQVSPQTGGYLIKFTRTAAGSEKVTGWGEKVPVTAGVSYYASCYAGPTGIPTGVYLEFLNAANAVLASTSMFINVNTPAKQATATAPVGATQARISFSLGYGATGIYGTVAALSIKTAADATNGPPGYWDGDTADTSSWLYSWASTAHASESLAVPAGVGLSYIVPRSYTDVLDTALEVSVTRHPLDVGTLGATVRDTNLDPAQTSAIRPGRHARLLARDPGGVYRDLYNGTLDQAVVAYDLKKRQGNQVRVSLSASDVNADLANQSAAQAVGTIAELPYVLEGKGVPWNVDGSGNQTPSAVVRSTSDSANVLDQVALTRDSALGYAWTDVRGVLMARTDRAASYYSGEPYVLDEGDYTDLEVSFDTAAVINVVTVIRQETNAATGEPEEVTYGPYVDAASKREWKARAATFTVTSNINPTTYAAAVLAANSQPVLRVSGLSIPIRDQADVVPAKALLDLYAKVQVINAAKGIDQVLRVTSITHKISAKRWYMAVGFDALGAVASPAVQPPATGALADVDTTLLTLVSPFAVQSYQPRVRKVDGVVEYDGNLNRTGGMVASTVYTVVAAGGVPSDCRPSRQMNIPAATNSAPTVRAVFNTDGSVQIVTGTVVPSYVALDGIAFRK